MSSKSDQEPIINPNPTLQTYYNTLESRLGYALLLNGARHFGYYEKDTYWPFPFDRALRAMEDKLAESLNLPPGSAVLDAGCGTGRVAGRLAGYHGLNVLGIDIVDHHLEKARGFIERGGLGGRQNQAQAQGKGQGKVTLRKMDYHHLETLPDESFHGVYTMETFSHATDPRGVLAGFYRVLKQGGRLSLFEYDHTLGIGSTSPSTSKPTDLATSMAQINEYSAMPTNTHSLPGALKTLLENAGFQDVVVTDYSANIVPMTRVFFILAYIPFLLVSFLGLERYFVNTVAGVQSYRGRGFWRYVNVTGRKPGILDGGWDGKAAEERKDR
ncbi:class I SAM-dependent methyltransferase [Aspergillus stella-maris]|uniref:class I SAM-dependent methyltransferase n=1 Tax=Aspergillus stella-maris TaxID=1810926 RepID=UPI003CCCD45A